MREKDDIIICRCEEITEDEIRNAVKAGYTTIKAIKRKTRAGMGLCQGRTCAPLIRDIIASMTGNRKEDILPDTARFPAYPLKLVTLTKETIDG